MTESSRVIIVSKDNVFKIALLHELRQYKELEVIITPVNLVTASTVIKKIGKNIILIDVENQEISEPYVRKLQSENNISFISVGFSGSLNLGGVTGFIQKPKSFNDTFFGVFAKEILKRINNSNNVINNRMPNIVTGTGNGVSINSKLIAIASSTGGTEALPALLSKLPENVPPILVVQHMPAGFTKQFAERLDKLCKFRVCEAQNNEPILRNTAYIAPGDYHMEVVKRGATLAIRTNQEEKIQALRPAADNLFQSLLAINPQSVIGVILTGMGGDGAKGLLELKKKGARIIGQDKESCVVYGMPKIAFDIGAVDYQLPLNMIANKIIELI